MNACSFMAANMIKVIDHQKMGRSELGWLHSLFHFSFAEYYNPNNIQFGNLRVVNDDRIEPGTGFDTHPHKNMEIISYVVDGELTHKDSMGNQRQLTRGQVQYMSAGTGVLHSEFNLTDQVSRFLQIWILPDKAGYAPNYGDYRFAWEDRENHWLQIVSSMQGDAPVKIHQDMNIFVTSLEIGMQLEYRLEKGRQAYLIQIEGSGNVNGNNLLTRDAAEITKEQVLTITANEKSHFILFDMKVMQDNDR